MLVTVISPAVSTATQTAASPSAGQQAGSVTRRKTCHGVPSSRACSSKAGSTVRKPSAAMSTIHGIAASVWTQRAAFQPVSQG